MRDTWKLGSYHKTGWTIKWPLKESQVFGFKRVEGDRREGRRWNGQEGRDLLLPGPMLFKLFFFYCTAFN